MPVLARHPALALTPASRRARAGAPGTAPRPRDADAQAFHLVATEPLRVLADFPSAFPLLPELAPTAGFRKSRLPGTTQSLVEPQGTRTGPPKSPSRSCRGCHCATRGLFSASGVPEAWQRLHQQAHRKTCCALATSRRGLRLSAASGRTSIHGYDPRSGCCHRDARRSRTAWEWAYAPEYGLPGLFAAQSARHSSSVQILLAGAPGLRLLRRIWGCPGRESPPPAHDWAAQTHPYRNRPLMRWLSASLS